MGADIKLIVAAQEVTPSEVMYAAVLPGAGTLVALDCGSLHRQVAWLRCRKQLNWGEWIDVRDSWCKHYRALLCTAVRGDTQTVKRVAERGMREGYLYLLLENV